QLRQIKKMGGLKDLLSHLPGIGGRLDELDVQGDELVVVESIIQSMTAQERQRPEILNTNRRRRIAGGSGRKVEDVTGLLRQFKQMQQMMQQMKKQQGFFGKLKGMREMKETLSGEGQTGATGVPGLPPGFPGLPGAPPAGPGGPGKKQTGPSLDERRKKRKMERQRRKNSRRR
ncbi:MAG: signal recognition particle protein, partial [Planctomycetes bacterium]|nr:signal recognition particle protein [Planctomycetota bacterium]